MRSREAASRTARQASAVTLVLFAVAAACWLSGTYLLATWWARRRPRRRDLAERLAPFAPTPLADAVEEWLRSHD